MLRTGLFMLILLFFPVRAMAELKTILFNLRSISALFHHLSIFLFGKYFHSKSFLAFWKQLSKQSIMQSQVLLPHNSLISACLWLFLSLPFPRRRLSCFSIFYAIFHWRNICVTCWSRWQSQLKAIPRTGPTHTGFFSSFVAARLR